MRMSPWMSQIKKIGKPLKTQWLLSQAHGDIAPSDHLHQDNLQPTFNPHHQNHHDPADQLLHMSLRYNKQLGGVSWKSHCQRMLRDLVFGSNNMRQSPLRFPCLNHIEAYLRRYDFETFFVGALKRRAVEVHEKHLTPSERQQFQVAKDAEVRNFVAAKAFEALPPELKPDRSQAIGMRWLLTWKLKEDGERKAKARAILQGYQDPSYEHRATTTPVMTRMTRQLLLHEAARKRWRVRKGDVTGAFLQGREYPQTLYCTPCPEICRAMGLKAGEITKIKRGCYGLVDAPLEWYRSVCEYLEELGLQACSFSCQNPMWRYIPFWTDQPFKISF